MKKLYIILLLAFAGLSGLQAQRFTGGLLLGLNASQIDGDGWGGYNKAGLSVGGFVRYPINRMLGFQPEFRYEQLGSATPELLLLKTSHLTMPLFLTAQTSVELGESSREFAFHIGPAAGLLISARDWIGFDYTAALRRFDLRAVAGFDAEIIKNLSISVEYGYSIASFVEVNQPGINNLFVGGRRPGLYHRYASFALRYHLIR